MALSCSNNTCKSVSHLFQSWSWRRCRCMQASSRKPWEVLGSSRSRSFHRCCNPKSFPPWWLPWATHCFNTDWAVQYAQMPPICMFRVDADANFQAMFMDYYNKRNEFSPEAMALADWTEMAQKNVSYVFKTVLAIKLTLHRDRMWIPLKYGKELILMKKLAATTLQNWQSTSSALSPTQPAMNVCSATWDLFTWVSTIK